MPTISRRRLLVVAGEPSVKVPPRGPAVVERSYQSWQTASVTDTVGAVRPLWRTVHATPLSQGVVAEFERLIAAGELTAGDRLPPERELAQLLGVGRNSVREALRQLELLGLIDSRRGDGTYVRGGDVSRLLGPFRVAVAASPATAEMVLEFRRTFEPDVAALAARNVDEQGVDRLVQALHRFERAVDHDDHPRAADSDFHAAIALATRNPVVIAVQEALASMLADFRDRLAASSYDATRRAARGHQAIFGAIVARDAEGARQAMLAHLDHVEAALRPDRERPGGSELWSDLDEPEGESV
jgi:GntR family transcriptional repressor for pyruvate dehydrogenase complex